jgi:hypothetical protein
MPTCNETGANKTDSNDIGFPLPPQAKPIFVTAYLGKSAAGTHIKDEPLAEVGRLAASVLR